MITDRQVRMLMSLIQKNKSLAVAAAKAGMDEKTARKYRDMPRPPSEVIPQHYWKTRSDPFLEVWEEVHPLLKANPGLEAKTIFEYLQRKYSGRFADGQLRTLQRKIKVWRAVDGPAKEVFFPQVHYPGILCESDFTTMNDLGVTIQKSPFPHLAYHFVLTYSNWETFTICFSESFENLSEGLQNALWTLGGIPQAHRTDRLTAAVQKVDSPEEFTQGYRALMKHYGLDGQKTQAASPNENGDVEQRHYRFKKAVDQALMLRGCRDFESREDYIAFLRKLVIQLNAGRQTLLEAELQVLKRLPEHRLEACRRSVVRVGPSSTIVVNHNTYSVHSRLIGERVEARLYAEHLEVWYAQRRVEIIPRLRGAEKYRIQYRHIIEWLVRKPGAFENYRYREELFPTSRFRMAYDGIKAKGLSTADRAYLQLLYLAANEGEALVDNALRQLLELGQPVTSQAVEQLLRASQALPAPTEVNVAVVNLQDYDQLLQEVA